MLDFKILTERIIFISFSLFSYSHGNIIIIPTKVIEEVSIAIKNRDLL